MCVCVCVCVFIWSHILFYNDSMGTNEMENIAPPANGDATMADTPWTAEDKADDLAILSTPKCYDRIT